MLSISLLKFGTAGWWVNIKVIMCQLNNFNKEKKTLAAIQSIDKTSNQAASQTAAGQLVFLS